MSLQRCDSTVFALMPNRTTIALVAMLSAIFVKRAAPTDRRASRGSGQRTSQSAWPPIQRSMSGSAAALTFSFNLIEAIAASTGRRASAGMSCSP
jgi:hypothetical protein